MLPSSSVSPSVHPTENRSNIPTHDAQDNACQHIRDLEKQVALSEGKLQESQRCFDSFISSRASHIESTVSCENDLKSSMQHNSDTLASLSAVIAKPSYAQVASLPVVVSSLTIPPPPSEKVLLVRPLEPNADSSPTRLLSKNLLFRITRIKNINNGGIAIYLITDEDESKLTQELANNADLAGFSITKPTRRKPQFILFGVNSSYYKDSITKALVFKKSIFKDGGFKVNFCIKLKSSNNWVISVIPDLFLIIKTHGYLHLNFKKVRIETFVSVMQWHLGSHKEPLLQ
ncbi:CCHC-type domain-containing protein [Trichonephila clavata]|uniref:CCHC-type domain-containing protein n=1 Tax=Trichonephila clavata TaxID=2740835 RepID=A0A8X6KBM7_TRICU|nr:CCHC-type domain-containing protein [Trichonephila clavata]